MATPQYKIIEAQEEEIVRLKAELSETEEKPSDNISECLLGQKNSIKN